MTEELSTEGLQSNLFTVRVQTDEKTEHLSRSRCIQRFQREERSIFQNKRTIFIKSSDELSATGFGKLRIKGFEHDSHS